MSSSNVNTTRRRLDFGRKRNAPLPAARRSLSASYLDDILPPHAMKHVLDFYASATPPEEDKTPVEQQNEAHASGVRNMVREGHRRDNARDCANVIRETLKGRADEQLKNDEWMFSGVPVEREA